MHIWYADYSINDLHERSRNTMIDYLGIQLTELGENYLSGIMPVDHRTVQPMGILHGGASVALGETLGNLAANLVVDPTRFYCVGMEINANHLRSVTSGVVKGKATPFHMGSSTHVWGIEIKDEQGRMVCISRITMAVLKKNMKK